MLSGEALPDKTVAKDVVKKSRMTGLVMIVCEFLLDIGNLEAVYWLSVVPEAARAQGRIRNRRVAWCGRPDPGDATNHETRTTDGRNKS